MFLGLNFFLIIILVFDFVKLIKELGKEFEKNLSKIQEKIASFKFDGFLKTNLYDLVLLNPPLKSFYEYDTVYSIIALTYLIQ